MEEVSSVAGLLVHSRKIDGLTPLAFIGYSWLTNEHGLTVDNIVSFELALPDGTVINVDESTPDLLFGLKVCLSTNYVKND